MQLAIMALANLIWIKQKLKNLWLLIVQTKTYFRKYTVLPVKIYR